jgi:hypothetical protein
MLSVLWLALGSLLRIFRNLSLATTLSDFEINNIAGGLLPEFCYNSDYAQRAVVAPSVRNRRDHIFENFALRQQLTVLKRPRSRPALNLFDKFFWVAISRLWSQWKQSIIVVTPETVVRWHRAGFRVYWRLISRVRGPVGRRSCGS